MRQKEAERGSESWTTPSITNRCRLVSDATQMRLQQGKGKTTLEIKARTRRRLGTSIQVGSSIHHHHARWVLQVIYLRQHTK